MFDWVLNTPLCKCINPFAPTVPFLCPLEAFHGAEKESTGNKWVNSNTCETSEFIKKCIKNQLVNWKTSKLHSKLQ